MVLTKNEACNVPRAFASVPAGAPLLVVDGESADETVALARAVGAEVMVRPWEGFVSARCFALEHVRTPWTFMLDADEALDDAARAALSSLEPPAATDAYCIERVTYFCGKPVRHGAWGGEAPLRLFRTTRALLIAEPAAGGSADLHERWIVAGAVGTLGGTLAHDSYPTLAAYSEKFRRYTTLEARGSRPSSFALARATALAFVGAPWALVVKGGWRDGWRGAFVALASAAYPLAVAWKALRR